MTAHSEFLHDTMAMALAGATLPAANAWACGGYAESVEAPRPEDAQARGRPGLDVPVHPGRGRLRGLQNENT